MIEAARVGVSGFPEYNKAVPEGDFMAVYDKILLDRANMYIDETINHTNGNATGVDDWNGNNQIAISSWTKLNDNTTVYGSVAYSWGGCDTVNDFNEDLENQRNTIAAWYTVNPNVNHPEYSNWNFTIAPNNTWGLTEDNNAVSYRFGLSPSQTQGAHQHAYDPLNINNVTYYPYTPGFVIKRRNHNGDYNDAEFAIYTRYGAGVDCTGFIQRCASYTNNSYTLTDNTNERLVWGTTWNWGLASKVNPGDTTTWSIPNNMRSVIVPGDILLGPAHAVMVLKIEYPNNSRTILPANVTVLEAAGWDQKWRVMNDKTWEDIGENEFLPFRLMQNN